MLWFYTWIKKISYLCYKLFWPGPFCTWSGFLFKRENWIHITTQSFPNNLAEGRERFVDSSCYTVIPSLFLLCPKGNWSQSTTDPLLSVRGTFFLKIDQSKRIETRADARAICHWEKTAKEGITIFRVSRILSKIKVCIKTGNILNTWNGIGVCLWEGDVSDFFNSSPCKLKRTK